MTAALSYTGPRHALDVYERTGLGYVAPVASRGDRGDSGRIYAESPSQNRVLFAIGQGFANVYDFSSGENRAPVALPGTASLATLGNFVRHVLSVGSFKQVRRVAARRIVAGMQNMQRYSDRMQAPGQSERNPLGRHIASVNGHTAVAIGEQCPSKRPALPGPSSVDFGPEALCQWDARRAAMSVPTLTLGSVLTRLARRGETERATTVAAKKLERRRLRLPTLATPLRDLYRHLVHWVTSSGPVPGCSNTPGTLAWSVA